jgi:catechol 2,3-dioxygenase-like lactoylglutathione lyase family enzyme
VGKSDLQRNVTMAPTISGISPLFIVADVSATLSFYRDMLGFEVTFRGPTPDDEFFGIVRRDGAMIMFKALGVLSDGKEVAVEPVPNYKRKPAFSWDAYLEVPDPEALAAEFASRGVRFSVPLGEDDDLRGFVIEDIDGYGLFFGHS